MQHKFLEGFAYNFNENFLLHLSNFQFNLLFITKESVFFSFKLSVFNFNKFLLQRIAFKRDKVRTMNNFKIQYFSLKSATLHRICFISCFNQTTIQKLLWEMGCRIRNWNCIWKHLLFPHVSFLEKEKELYWLKYENKYSFNKKNVSKNDFVHHIVLTKIVLVIILWRQWWN